MVGTCLFHDLDLSWWPAVVHAFDSLACFYHNGICCILIAFSAEPLLDRLLCALH